MTPRGPAPSAGERDGKDDRSGLNEAQPAIEFRLDPSSGVPAYRQIIAQVEQAMRLGYVGRGDQLPKVKDVVRALAINPNTVLKAYHELEVRGLVTGKPGSGTFIEFELPVVGLPARTELRRRLMTWLDGAAQAGLDRLDIEALFTLTFHEYLKKAGTPQAAASPLSATRPESDIA